MPETQLSFVNREISASKNSQVEGRWITTTDKKKMLTWVIYPPDFDPSKNILQYFTAKEDSEHSKPVLFLSLELPAYGC